MVSYACPNVSELNRGGRGGLRDRWVLAKESGCAFVEMPADFVKNKTEVTLTGFGDGHGITVTASGHGRIPASRPCRPLAKYWAMDPQDPSRALDSKALN